MKNVVLKVALGLSLASAAALAQGALLELKETILLVQNLS